MLPKTKVDQISSELAYILGELRFDRMDITLVDALLWNLETRLELYKLKCDYHEAKEQNPRLSIEVLEALGMEDLRDKEALELCELGLQYGRREIEIIKKGGKEENEPTNKHRHFGLCITVFHPASTFENLKYEDRDYEDYCHLFNMIEILGESDLLMCTIRQGVSPQTAISILTEINEKLKRYGNKMLNLSEGAMGGFTPDGRMKIIEDDQETIYGDEPKPEDEDESE